MIKKHFTPGRVGILVVMLSLALVAVVAVMFAPAHITSATSTQMVQDGFDVQVLPEALQRLSWGAVIAGTLLSLVFMFMFNIIGIAIGLTQINPESNHGSADGKELAMASMGWIVASNFVALFIGGWVAAYFAGIPEVTDGILHGIMVWAVSGVIVTILVYSGIGQAMNGLASLISSSLDLTGAVAKGAGHVASGTLHTAGSVASGIGSLSAQTLSVLANGVQNSAQIAASGVSTLTDTAIENSPDVQNALKYQDLSAEQIRLEAKKLIRDANQDPEKVQGQAEEAVDDVVTGVKKAIQHPEHADEILNVTLQRVFRRGENIVSDVDRDALVTVLTERANITETQARQQIEEWENEFNKVKEQTQKAREVAKQKAEEFRLQAEQKAQEAYDKAQAKVDELQKEAEVKLHEAEDKAREVAQKTSETFAKIAAGIAVAMVVGAFAAGLGGYLGAPDELPDVEVTDTTSTTLPHVIHH